MKKLKLKVEDLEERIAPTLVISTGTVAGDITIAEPATDPNTIVAPDGVVKATLPAGHDGGPWNAGNGDVGGSSGHDTPVEH
jgi:hypothetical protein